MHIDDCTPIFFRISHYTMIFILKKWSRKVWSLVSFFIFYSTVHAPLQKPLPYIRLQCCGAGPFLTGSSSGSRYFFFTGSSSGSF